MACASQVADQVRAFAALRIKLLGQWGQNAFLPIYISVISKPTEDSTRSGHSGLVWTVRLPAGHVTGLHCNMSASSNQFHPTTLYPAGNNKRPPLLHLTNGGRGEQLQYSWIPIRQMPRRGLVVSEWRAGLPTCVLPCCAKLAYLNAPIQPSAHNARPRHPIVSSSQLR